MLKNLGKISNLNTNGIDLTNSAGISKFLNGVNANGQLDTAKAARELATQQSLYTLAQNVGISDKDFTNMIKNTLNAVVNNDGKLELSEEELSEALKNITDSLNSKKAASQSAKRPEMGLGDIPETQEPILDTDTDKVSPEVKAALMETLNKIAANYSKTGSYAYNPEENSDIIYNNAEVHITQIHKTNIFKTNGQNPGVIGETPDGSLYQTRIQDAVELYLVYEINGEQYRTETVEVPAYAPRAHTTDIEVVEDGDNFQ